MKKLKQIPLSVALVIGSTGAFAIEPASIGEGAVFLTPVLKLSESYDDNYTTTNVAQSSWITSVQPTLTVSGEGKKSLYQLSYTLDHQLFHETNTQNVTNHFVSGLADISFDIRNNLNLQAGYSKTESFSDVYTAGSSNSFADSNIGGLYVYGAPSAMFNVELGYSRVAKRSENGVNLDQERDSNTVSGALVYNNDNGASLLAEIKGSQYDYVSNTTLDSSNIAYLVGARWEATAKTTGSVKVGSEIKDFKDAAKDNVSLNSWQASVEWSPQTYSIFTLTTEQKIDEGSFSATHVNSQNNDVKWLHDWGKGLMSTVKLGNASKEYSTGRKDDLLNAGVGLTYEARRWMDVSVDYQYTDQNSTDATYDYKRGIVKLAVDVSL